MSSDKEWLGSVKAHTLAEVAPRIGLTGGRMGSFGPCPGCRSEKRSADDRRGPLGAAKDGKGWRCHAKGCDAHGDVLDLIALVRTGRDSSKFNGAEWADLRKFCSESGWCFDTGERAPVQPVGRLLGQRPPRRALASSTASRSGEGEGEPGEEAGGEPTAHVEGGAFAWREGHAEACAAALWEKPMPPGAAEVLEYLMDGRKLSEETVRRWQLGVAVVAGKPWLTIPLKDKHERIVNIRFRSLPPEKKAYRVCPGRPLPLYGEHTLGNNTKDPVIITEGEMDVVALDEYGVRGNVVSGTAGAGALKDEWLDVLEPYSGFLLCYDNDEAGNAGANGFAEKMGQDRCARITLPRKDAGDCLIDGVPAESITRAIKGAQPMFGVQLRTVDSYSGELEVLINHPEQLVGDKTGSAHLDRCLGGMRPGLMVVSGDTGHGKTTFATWLMWEQAHAGHGVMITSFEQRPVFTVQKLLRMQLGGDFLKVTAPERAAALDELGQLPLHVLDHYGTIKPDQLMASIRYAARRYGIKRVLVDHLGFLLEPGDDAVSQIETIIRALAITAYTVGVTIVLICHPKSLPHDAVRPTINDLKGASAIKQDASEVMIVVRDPPRPTGKNPRPWPATWVYIDKVRSEFGTPDSKALLAFGPMSCVYADTWLAVPEGARGMVVALPGTP